LWQKTKQTIGGQHGLCHCVDRPVTASNDDSAGMFLRLLRRLFRDRTQLFRILNCQNFVTLMRLAQNRFDVFAALACIRRPGCGVHHNVERCVACRRRRNHGVRRLFSDINNAEV